MKKFLALTLLSFLYLITTITFQKTCFALSKYTNFVYARIISDNCFLFKTNQEDSALFEIPKTYFVMLLADVDNSLYKAQYKDEVGFVKKNMVMPCQETPTSPFLNNNTFRVFSTDGTQARSEPNFSSQIVFEVTVQQKVEFYGKIYGEEAVEGRTNIWFYGKIKNQKDGGYFYSGFCDQQDEIIPNTEQITLNKNVFSSEQNFDYLFNLITISTTTKVVLITLTILSCFAFSFLMFFPFSKKAQSNKKHFQKTNKNIAINKIQKVIDDDNSL